MTTLKTIHKDGEEGVIQVDAQSGMITTDINDRPDWAEGLATALLQDRLTFYAKRMGTGSKDYKAVAAADTINLDDLDFIGVNADGAEMTLAHDPEYRVEVVAKALGIDTEEGTGLSDNSLAEREVSRENVGRTQAEIEAFEESMEAGFGAPAKEATRTATMADRSR